MKGVSIVTSFLAVIVTFIYQQLLVIVLNAITANVTYLPGIAVFAWKYFMISYIITMVLLIPSENVGLGKKVGMGISLVTALASALIMSSVLLLMGSAMEQNLGYNGVTTFALIYTYSVSISALAIPPLWALKKLTDSYESDEQFVDSYTLIGGGVE